MESVVKKKVCFRFFRQAQSSDLLYDKFFCFIIFEKFEKNLTNTVEKATELSLF